MNYCYYFISSFFLIGNFPLAPGTFASFVALFIWWLIPTNFVINIFIIVLLTLIGIYSSYKTELYLNKKDPSLIVIDEVIGMFISLLCVPNEFNLYLIAFIIFRFLDIYKPSYINTIQKYPYGFGVIGDDVLAGILTCLLLHILLL